MCSFFMISREALYERWGMWLSTWNRKRQMKQNQPKVMLIWTSLETADLCVPDTKPGDVTLFTCGSKNITRLWCDCPREERLLPRQLSARPRLCARSTFVSGHVLFWMNASPRCERYRRCIIPTQHPLLPPPGDVTSRRNQPRAEFYVNFFLK